MVDSKYLNKTLYKTFLKKILRFNLITIFSYTVPKKEVTEFTREVGSRVDTSVLAEAVDKAVKYLDEDELPIHWEKNSLFNTQNQDGDSDGNFTDVSSKIKQKNNINFVNTCTAILLINITWVYF